MKDEILNRLIEERKRFHATENVRKKLLERKEDREFKEMVVVSMREVKPVKPIKVKRERPVRRIVEKKINWDTLRLFYRNHYA